MEHVSRGSQEQPARFAGAANSLASFRVVPSGAALGAEIRGVAFSAPVPEDLKAALRKAWADHMVLLVRGQALTDDHLLATSLIFGLRKGIITRSCPPRAEISTSDQYSSPPTSSNLIKKILLPSAENCGSR